MSRSITVDLAMWKTIDQYKPQVGDVIIWHGWAVSHWYGIISEIGADGIVSIMHAGIPSLLFDTKKKMKQVKLQDINSSTGGEYTALRPHNNSLIWFIS